MGNGAGRMFGWAVEDAPAGAPDGQGAGVNAAEIFRLAGSDLPVVG